ncbi:NAD(P)H-binding protein [Nocardiopsis alba]|uniref:NAD(P)H-binding protein n=1 Tax=Nocardiopsis alba TaxID=53437 RepID=UPI0035E35255
MTQNKEQRPILVTAATGMTGSRVVAGLRARGHEVRAASRSSDWRFDWNDTDAWDRVLEGAGAVYLVQNDENPRVPEFVKHVKALGVGRVVLLSARGIDEPDYFEDVTGTPSHLTAEEAVKAGGTEWTILRPGWFAQNFDEGLLADGVRSGVLRLPTAEGAVTWIDAEDIADVAVAALTGEGHHGRTYELGGPRTSTLAEAVGEISAALGREVRYEPVSVEEYVEGLMKEGWSEAGAREMVVALSAIRRGREARISTGVREALGREPRDFSEYVARAFRRDGGAS